MKPLWVWTTVQSGQVKSWKSNWWHLNSNFYYSCPTQQTICHGKDNSLYKRTSSFWNTPFEVFKGSNVDIFYFLFIWTNHQVIVLTSCRSVPVSSLNWPSAVCLAELSLPTYKETYHKMPHQDDKWSLGSIVLIERWLTAASMSAAGDTGHTGAPLEGEAPGLFPSPASRIMQASIQSERSTWGRRVTLEYMRFAQLCSHLASALWLPLLDLSSNSKDLQDKTLHLVFDNVTTCNFLHSFIWFSPSASRAYWRFCSSRMSLQDLKSKKSINNNNTMFLLSKSKQKTTKLSKYKLLDYKIISHLVRNFEIWSNFSASIFASSSSVCWEVFVRCWHSCSSFWSGTTRSRRSTIQRVWAMLTAVIWFRIRSTDNFWVRVRAYS